MSELHSGHQSLVFLASAGTDQLIVKMLGDEHDLDLVRRRTELLDRLAETNPAVVGPVGLRSDLVTCIENWQVVCYPYVEGRAPSIEDRNDVEAMAEALASLHESMLVMGGAVLPPVAALRNADVKWLSTGQLIHGDFADANVILTRFGLRIIDFDDCGHGSVEFELGNTLYMVLFDAWNSGDLDRYHRFRSWFVDTYEQAASRTIDGGVLDDAIEVRARALKRWLIRPYDAPVGIRSASTTWQERLRAFIDDQDWRATR